MFTGSVFGRAFDRADCVGAELALAIAFVIVLLAEELRTGYSFIVIEGVNGVEVELEVHVARVVNRGH